MGTKFESIVLGMGCFWGAEKRMAKLAGVCDVESGYANGDVDGNYEAVLAQERDQRMGISNRRNHAEVVKVVFDPQEVTLETVLIRFWESHDPTQGDRQGNDIGTNYRSAIYTNGDSQQTTALKTCDIYQQALTRAGFGKITTEIAPLARYFPAEDYHQDYLEKNPGGYCGLGGTGVIYPATHASAAAVATPTQPTLTLDASTLSAQRQLIVFEAAGCPFCKQFAADLLANWNADVPIVRTLARTAPSGWKLAEALFATPTIVLFEAGKEVSRHTGYTGGKARFWAWLGSQLLSPAQREIAFNQGTEYAFTGAHIDEKRPGRFIDPITGATLFRSDSKFDSGCGWPSFTTPAESAVTLHADNSHGMRRVEVRSASSGIHLGHLFDDGPAPTHKRFCINGNVLKFVPDDKDGAT